MRADPRQSIRAANMLIYLPGSRYCKTDRLTGVARGRFGHLPQG